MPGVAATPASSSIRLAKSRLSSVEARNVGVEIERAVDGEEPLKPGLRQSVDQDAAVFLVAVLDGLHLVAPVEGRRRRDLRERRHRDREVLLQALDRPHQRIRHHHPADAPAGHAEVFRERIDDHRMVGELRRGLGRERIVEPVIDLVGDEADALAFRRGDQLGERLGPHHGAGRIGRACDQHALERRAPVRLPAAARP